MRFLDAEIGRLVLKLRLAKIPEAVIEESVMEIKVRVFQAAEEAAVEAYYEAQAIGEARKLDDFLNDLNIDVKGGDYEISTFSGRTDFSEPPFPMLPKLLKNAKVAADGSRYKVIPIRKKTSSTAPNTTGTEGTAAALNEARRQIRNQRRTRAFNPADRPTTFSEINNRNRQQRQRTRQTVQTRGDVDFRTASSKQDPNTRWVNPGKDGDMSAVLNQINSDLRQTIDDIIASIIAEYERFI